MKCSKCDDPARLAILNEDGSYYAENAMCCACMLKDMKKELKDRPKKAKKEDMN